MSSVDYHHVDATIRGCEYAISLKVSDNNLAVDVEDKGTCDRWRGDFSASFVEEMTRKVNNAKKFSVFCKMLITAVSEKSDSVSIDLLTPEDLEALRRRQSGTSSSNVSGSSASAHADHTKTSSSNHSRRYLILTYTVEFDRVNYPLSLQYDESPDPNYLKATIASLRRQVKELSSRPGAESQDLDYVRRMQDENARLRDEYVKLRDQSSQEASELAKRISKQGKELDVLRKQLLEFPQTTANREDKIAREKDREIARLQKKLDRYREDLAGFTADNAQLRSQVRVLQRKLDVSGRYTTGGKTSRSPTPVRSTSSDRLRTPPSAIRSARLSSRPSPVPMSGSSRFDPTAWVRQQQEKKDARRTRSPSPIPSRPSSAKPPRSRSSSAERDGASSRERPSSRSRVREDESALDAHLLTQLTRRHTYESSEDELWDGSDDRKGRSARHAGSHHTSGAGSSSRRTSAGSGGSPLRAATSEISDIDKRLSALQDFLQEAKRKSLLTKNP